MNQHKTQRKTEGLPRRERRSVDGLLLLDKPVGLTSNAALQRVKWLFRANKAGHTGSLDPLASGMLPLCFGQATKVSAYLLEADKTYRVTPRFGTKTDTGDADGTVVTESDIRAVERAALESALEQLTGEIEQIPPMYSALKKDGKRLYELARQGIEVDRPARPVTIRSLEIERYDSEAPVIRVACSKGTYVRTLVEDLAGLLGTVGHVTALRRLTVEPFTDARLVTMEEVETAAEAGDEALDALLIPIDSALVVLPAVNLNREQSWYLRHGNPVQVVRPPQAGFCRIYDEQARFVGVGEALRDGRIAPKRLFVAPESAVG
jgi:tRNA pseudouridine55 synthase